MTTFRDFSTDKDYWTCSRHDGEANNRSEDFTAKFDALSIQDQHHLVGRYAPLPFSVPWPKVVAHGKKVKHVLEGFANSRTLTVDELVAGIQTYDDFRSEFPSLRNFFENVVPHETSQAFLTCLLPKIARLALDLERLVPEPLLLLLSHTNASVTLSQLQVASIMANAFFCTFPERMRKGQSEGRRFNPINMSRMFDWKLYPHIGQKIRAVMHYFECVLNEAPSGNVTFLRQRVTAVPNWAGSDLPLACIEVFEDGKIEDAGNRASQVDFANAFIGGGVLRSGCVQEEIRFMLCPEMIASCLLCEKMEDDEAITILGAEQYSDHDGYAKTFMWKPFEKPTATQRDKHGRAYSEVVAINALRFTPSQKIQQYRKENIRRELLKAYAGFSVRTCQSSQAIATGNWGCGAYNGDLELKSLIQLIAATVAGRSLLYYTFGNFDFAQRLRDMVEFLTEHKVTTGALYTLLTDYSAIVDFDASSKGDKRKRNLVFEPVFSFIRSRIPDAL